MRFDIKNNRTLLSRWVLNYIPTYVILAFFGLSHVIVAPISS